MPSVALTTGVSFPMSATTWESPASTACLSCPTTGASPVMSTDLTTMQSPTQSAMSAVSTPSLDASPITSFITHRVDVGAERELRFRPQSINAAVGDMIIFSFLRLNHTVTQSTFDQPCIASEGFDSGFEFFNPTNQTGIINQRLAYLVRDSEPNWFFCRQTNPTSHCGAGMVFAINAGDLWTEFRDNAAKAASVASISHRPIDPSARYPRLSHGGSFHSSGYATGTASQTGGLHLSPTPLFASRAEVKHVGISRVLWLTLLLFLVL